jgi:stearoyl-CoA desaturase (delta-9 desaturase)
LNTPLSQKEEIWWSATHRRHHRFSDHPGDPHSPHLHGAGFRAFLKGQFHAHMGWLFVPESTRALGWDGYARDLYRNKAIFKVDIMYFYWLALGFIIPAIVGGIVTRTCMGAFLGFLWGGPVRVFMMDHVFYIPSPMPRQKRCGQSRATKLRSRRG